MKTSPAGNALFEAYALACHGKSDWTQECVWWERVCRRFGIDIFM